MTILRRAASGLAILYLFAGTVVVFGCDRMPAGQALWIRLTAPVSTYNAKVGDAVHGVLTQDVVCDASVLIPMGTPVEGVVRAKRKVGFGIRHETASLDLEFTKVKVDGEAPIQIVARIDEVENAREVVKNGVVQGVLSSDTFQGRINSRLIHMPTWNPYSDLGLIVYKATFPIFPEPEIYYPSGTDMRLKLKADLTAPVLETQEQQEVSLLSPQWSETEGLVRGLPERATTQKFADADLVNLVFVGSRQQLESAFSEAGWNASDKVSRHAVMQNLYALLNNSAYSRQPMTPFLLQGQSSAMTWQKTLNSYGRRDHLRIWQWSGSGAEGTVWASSSTHDTTAALSVKYHGFVHHITPNIDDERSTVIRDLSFSGCVQSVHYVQRPRVFSLTQNAIGDPVRTDGAVAVVKIKDCDPLVPGLTLPATGATYKPGNHAFRYLRRQILTFRSDIWRANIIYGAYDLGRMSYLALRHQAPLPSPAESQSAAQADVNADHSQPGSW